MSAVLSRPAEDPFSLERTDAYRRWRERKLAAYPKRAEDLFVEVRDPRNLTDSEADQLRRICALSNMAVYASPLGDLADKDLVRSVGARLGLERLQANPFADEDGISSLETAPGKSARGYIPYSNRRLLWHTDGYYNPPAQRIRAFILHCVRPAASGGENRFLDHEIAYLMLRDADPEHVRALMAANAMTIPANTGEGMEPRPPQSGPVFSSEAGALHMRYTARTRSIEWRENEATRIAAERLNRILEEASPYMFTLRLAPGQGLICNNVLHDRSAFTDAPAAGRLVYRARYCDRVAAP